MEKIILLLFIIACFAAIMLLNKYRNTKVGLIIRFCWFAIGISIFFSFFSHNFSMTQNIVMGFFGGGGLVYFFFKFKRISENSHH